MFAAYCYRHETRVLLPTEAITDLVSTPTGMIAHFTCHCGSAGVWRPEVSFRTATS